MVHIVIIGGGPAGVTAALESARLGADVTLIEAAHLGGRATWHSLVPSKVFLSAAEALTAAHPWLENPPSRPNLDTLRARVRAQAEAQSQRQHHALSQAGVRLIEAVARFEGPHTLRLEFTAGHSERLDVERVILATGSEPIFLPGLKPDGQRLLAPRAMANLTAWPEHLIMIGGGVTGSEYVSFFSQMGVSITWVTDLPTFLPRAEPEIAAGLAAAMEARGVRLYPNAPVAQAENTGSGVRVTLQDGRTLEGSHAFIAIGRRADTERLNLDYAGVEVTRQGVVVDDYGRTNQPHIYAIGDVAGPPYTVNRAQAQARVAVRHALGLPTPPLKANTWVEAVYSDPQVAQVGLCEDEARRLGYVITVLHAEAAQTLKAHLGNHPQGRLKIIAEASSGRLLGAAALGGHAVEVINALSLALQAGATVEHLMQWAPAYPTWGDLVRAAVDGYGV
jgi:dihydrolipoamide dehydrogenase